MGGFAVGGTIREWVLYPFCTKNRNSFLRSPLPMYLSGTIWYPFPVIIITNFARSFVSPHTLDNTTQTTPHTFLPVVSTIPPLLKTWASSSHWTSFLFLSTFFLITHLQVVILSLTNQPLGLYLIDYPVNPLTLTLHSEGRSSGSLLSSSRVETSVGWDPNSRSGY